VANFNNLPNEHQRFLFDPNEIDKEELVLLGFSSKNAATIENYANKGGRFRKPEDLYKIWGIDSLLVNELLPFIRIKNTETNHGKREKSGMKLNPDDYGNWHLLKYNEQKPVELNSASEKELEKLWGVREKLAVKIVNYREQLGGFVHPYQLLEIYGIDSIFFEKNEYRITLKNKEIQQIKINQEDRENLQKHPYISWKLAETLVNNRKHHGPFTEIKDLSRIVSIKEEQINRLKPYLSFE
jgi:competence ComEA-like helix-hairpin-helix protein